MKTTFLIIIILLSMTISQAQEIYVVNSNSETISHVQIDTFSATNNFAQIGQYGNHIAYHSDRLYVVNSGDNSIQIIDTDGTTQGYFYLEDSSNPWHINIHDGYIYVTGLFTGKLYRIDLNAPHSASYMGGASSELFVGTAPQGMLFYDNKMYVALTGLNYPNYGQGKIAIIDLESFSIIDTVDVATNPQELLVDSRGYIHVVCTGDYAEQLTKVVIFDSQSLEIIHTIDFDWSFFTTIQMSADGLVYIGNGLGLGFATYHPLTFEIINGYGNTIFSGGQYLIYDSQYVYVLAPDWWSNSLLKVYTHDHSLVSEIALGIGSSAMVLLDGNVSIGDIVKPNILEIYAYPNPFVSEINFEIKGISSDFSIDIFNIRGQKVATTQNMSWDGKDRNGRDMPAGVYLARVSDRENMVVKKILKTK